ncbi:MAG: hypothetical protein ABIJ28_00730 [Patescibacteria group bacterium]
MAKHKPIKFVSTLEPNFKKYITKIMKENPNAKTAVNATLGLIALEGILTFGAAFPALLGEIGKIRSRQKREIYKEYQQYWRSFNELKKKRAIEFVKEEGGYLVYKINKKGKEKLKKFVLDELIIQKSKQWDKKWRLVIFDIPEIYRKSRDALRKKLKDLGFYQCQKSAWIYPFDCIDEIEFLKDFFSIKPFVKIFIVDEIDDGKVLYHFKDEIKKSV